MLKMKEIYIFFSSFFLSWTVVKNAAICRTIDGHIPTQGILSFQMVPEPGSHQLALLRYDKKSEPGSIFIFEFCF